MNSFYSLFYYLGFVRSDVSVDIMNTEVFIKKVNEKKTYVLLWRFTLKNVIVFDVPSFNEVGTYYVDEAILNKVFKTDVELYRALKKVNVNRRNN